MAKPDIQWWQRYGNIAQIGSAIFALVGFGAGIVNRTLAGFGF